MDQHLCNSRITCVNQPKTLNPLEKKAGKLVEIRKKKRLREAIRTYRWFFFWVVVRYFARRCIDYLQCLGPMDSTLITLNSSRAMAFVNFADLSPCIGQGRRTLQSSFGNYGVSARPVIRLRVSNRQRVTSVRATADAATTAPGSMKPAILLTENALKHLNKMKVERKEDLCLRIGVRQGGCSGMSYVMDFEQRANLRSDDAIIDYDGFTIVCDPKSLLFLYGMQLDFSDALIGGGFSFKNPNATSTCGCGKSFAA